MRIKMGPGMIPVEYCACDSLKVILRMCEYLMLTARLQKQDILAVVRHDITRLRITPKRRPKAPSAWWRDWTSDDYYTRDPGLPPANAGAAFDAILEHCTQLMCCDGLSAGRTLALIESDIDRHFAETDC